jgi:hypothetical protein
MAWKNSRLVRLLAEPKERESHRRANGSPE